MKKTIIKNLSTLLGFKEGKEQETPRETGGIYDGRQSVLSELRDNICLSEQILYHAEKNCRLIEQQYHFGGIDFGELHDARETLAKAKIFFVQSLCELQNVLTEFGRGGRDYAVEEINYERAS